MIVNNNLVGGWPTPLKNMTNRQLGWWNSQYDGKIKFHGSKPPTSCCCGRCGYCWLFLGFWVLFAGCHLSFFVSCLLLVGCCRLSCFVVDWLVAFLYSWFCRCWFLGLPNKSFPGVLLNIPVSQSYDYYRKQTSWATPKWIGPVLKRDFYAWEYLM